MKIFVFGIGGTGARVLRSLSMMLATGVRIPENTEIIPVIVDMDVQNGDTNRSMQALELYRKIHTKAYTQKATEGFFLGNMTTLGANVDNNIASEQRIKDAFQLDFGNVKDTFYRYLNGSQLTPANLDLLSLLYDDSPENNSKTELNINLTKGFKGNPNVGSIVFNDLVNTPEYKQFERMCQQTDRIFIISSIFGGTGSAGFPQLVRNVRSSNNNYLKNAKIGALVANPYFSIAEDEKSAIDSRNFNSKAKAALSYYDAEIYKYLNDVYYVGDKTFVPYLNHEGGAEQQNNAHVVEMLAAMSVINFANKTDEDFVPGAEFHEFGIQTDSNDLDFTSFFDDTKARYFVPMTRFAIFAKYFRENLKKDTKEAYYKNLELGNRLQQDPFFVNLRNFIEHYVGWLGEMANNKRGFAPFNLERIFKEMIKKKEIKRFDGDHILSYLNEFQNEAAKKGLKVTEEIFMHIFQEACNKVFEERIVQLPSA